MKLENLMTKKELDSLHEQSDLIFKKILDHKFESFSMNDTKLIKLHNQRNALNLRIQNSVTITR